MNPARNDDVRSKEAMVFDSTVVADMVSAPQSNVVTDGNKRLYGVIFQDEAVVADRRLVENGRFRADIAYKLIP